MYKDDQLVAKQMDDLTSLLASYPPAVEYEKYALRLKRSTMVLAVLGATLGIIGVLGGGSVLTVGVLKENYPMLIGGASGVLVLGVTGISLMVTSSKPGGRALTAEFNAVDIYNDHLLTNAGENH